MNFIYIYIQERTENSYIKDRIYILSITLEANMYHIIFKINNIYQSNRGVQ